MNELIGIHPSFTQLLFITATLFFFLSYLLSFFLSYLLSFLPSFPLFLPPLPFLLSS